MVCRIAKPASRMAVPRTEQAQFVGTGSGIRGKAPDYLLVKNESWIFGNDAPAYFSPMYARSCAA